MTTVVGGLSGAYLPLIDIWLEQSLDHMPVPPTIIAMDDLAFERLRDDRRVELLRATSTTELAGDRQSFWARRLREVAAIAQNGVETIHSDADAFWLASPMEIFAQIDADVIFTEDHGIPKNVMADWGFTLCCGYYVLRRSAALSTLLSAWCDRTEQVRDDQIALNQLVFECRPTWRTESLNALEIRVSDVQFQGYGLRIAVLPYHLFTRRPPYAAPGAIIAHPFFERRFFHSYLGLYGELLQEFGSLNQWQAQNFDSALEADVPVRDVATYQLLSRRLARPPADPRYLAHRGFLALRYGTFDDARADLEAACQQQDRSSATLLGLAEIEMRTGRTAESHAILLELLAQPDLELPILREMLQLAQRHGQFRTIAAMGWQAMRRFGARRMWRSGQAWIAKKRSKAL